MNPFQCQIHGRDLGRAIAAFEGAGFMVDRAATFPVGGGFYTLIVYAPSGMNAAGLDFRQLEQGNRQRSRRWRTIRKALLIVAILAAVAAIGYFGFTFFSAMFGGGVPEVPPVAAPELPTITLPDSLAGPLGQIRDGVTMALQAVIVIAVLLGLFMARGVLLPLFRGFAQGIGSVAGMLRRKG
jgi:hypothetical protein